MKTRYLLATALLCGCTTLSKISLAPPAAAAAAPGAQVSQVAPQSKVALIFRECDDLSLRSYPVLKKLISKGQVSPTVVCRLTDIIRCDEQPVQTITEVDANERARKSYLMECLRTKLSLA